MGLGICDVVWGIVWGIDDVFVDFDVLCDDEVVVGDGDLLDELVCCVVMLGKMDVIFEVIGFVVLLWCFDVVMVMGFDMFVLVDMVVSFGVVMVIFFDMVELVEFWVGDIGVVFNFNLLILILFFVRNKLKKWINK